MTSRQAGRRLGISLLVLVSTIACGSTAPRVTEASGAPDAGSAELNQETPRSATSSGASAATAGGTSAETNGGLSAATGGGRPRTAGGASRGGGTTAGGGTTNAGTPPRSITTPLKIGLTYINNESTEAAFDVSAGQTTNGKSAAQAVVKGINAAGGLNGRQLQTVEYSWNSQSNSYSQDATVACEMFTTDHRVEVVVDNAFGTIGGFSECLQKAGVLHISGGAEGDRESSRQRPLHAHLGMVYDRSYAAVLVNLAATRYLTKVNQLGIIVEDCPSIERAYTNAIAPLVARLGLKDPLKRTIECVTGFSSAGPAQSAISAAILAFRQAGVDRVMFISDYETVVLLLFANTADSQRYYPGYALSSNAQAGLYTELPEDQRPQLHGVGSSPQTDVRDDKAPPTAVEARCLRLAKAGGLTPANSIDKAFIYGPCGRILLLETALTRTGGDSTPTALKRAINGLGTSFLAPGVVAGGTRFSASRHDGGNAVRVFGYVVSCACMRYSGQPVLAPE